MKRAGPIVALFIGLVSCRAPVEPVLTPVEWSFGTIPADMPVEQEISVENPGRRRIEVSFISTCDCLTVQPSRLDLSQGAKQSVTLRYDPSEDVGEVVMQIIVRTKQGNATTRQLFRVFGRVSPIESTPETAVDRELQPVASQAVLSFEYFYDPGCKGCLNFLVRMMYELQEELNIRLHVEQRDIRTPEDYNLFTRRLVELHAEERALPAVVFGDIVLQGEEEIEREFKEVLRQHLNSSGEASGP